jgi:hypothetical protein
MVVSEAVRLPTLRVHADVRLRPDLLSLGIPGELVEVQRIRPARNDQSVGRANRSTVAGEVVGSPAATPTPGADHPLWGAWRIIGHSAPGVSAMSEARSAAWTGRAMEYTEPVARSPNGECLEPSYINPSESVDAFVSGECGVPASSLPLVADLGVVEVVEVRCAGSGWGAAGETVLSLDQRRALTPWDGVFFEPRRTR